MSVSLKEALEALEAEVQVQEMHFKTTLAFIADADVGDVPDLLRQAEEDLIQLTGARLALNSTRAIVEGRWPPRPEADFDEV